jgi:hypothetical protein
MHPPTMFALAVAATTCVHAPALAQRFPFEGTFEVNEPASLDVSTIRGEIDVTVGEPGRIVIGCTAIVAIAKRQRASTLSRHVEPCRSILAFTASDARRAIADVRLTLLRTEALQRTVRAALIYLCSLCS